MHLYKSHYSNVPLIGGRCYAKLVMYRVTEVLRGAPCRKRPCDVSCSNSVHALPPQATRTCVSRNVLK